MYIINGDNIDSTENKRVDILFKVNNRDTKTSSMVNVLVFFFLLLSRFLPAYNKRKKKHLTQYETFDPN